VFTPDDAYCDDGFYCNGAESCDPESGCMAGEAIDCDDGIDCTIDMCHEVARTCLYLPDDDSCDDGLFCTGTETCDTDLGCLSPGDPCIPDAWCNEDTDACEAYGDGDCDDDGDVDLADFARFQACFGGPSEGACEPANMVGDAMIGLDDLAAFIIELEASGPR
jgi:hypothetical protein